MNDNEELHLLEDYLSNNQIIHYKYINHNYKYDNCDFLKEQLDDRFYCLYTKHSEDYKLNNNNYEFAGFLDVIDKKIYNPNYQVIKILENSSIYLLSTLSELKEQIENKVSEKLCDYALSHASQLKNLCDEEFLKQDEYHFDYYQKEVNELFVSSENLQTIQLEHKQLLRYSYFSNNHNIPYSEYLSNSENTVKEIVNNLIKNDEIKKYLGWEILEAEYKNRYLDSIYKNPQKNNFLFVNREILSNIKDIDAVNLNITISYNNKELTFKTQKKRFEMGLRNAYTSDHYYGKSYEVVEKFLEENKNIKDNWYKHDFDFEHISKITYGKQVLYEANIDKNIEKEIDEIER